MVHLASPAGFEIASNQGVSSCSGDLAGCQIEPSGSNIPENPAVSARVSIVVTRVTKLLSELTPEERCDPRLVEAIRRLMPK